jgi:hypothetical protein
MAKVLRAPTNQLGQFGSWPILFTGLKAWISIEIQPSVEDRSIGKAGFPAGLKG